MNTKPVPATLVEILDVGEDFARHMLLTLGYEEFTPTWFIVQNKTELEVVTCPWDDEEEKIRMTAAVRRHCRDTNATLVCHISEAWMSVYEKDEDYTATRPSERANRVEVVILAASDGRRSSSRSLEMKRGESGKLLDLIRMDTKDVIDIGGRMIDGFVKVENETH